MISMMVQTKEEELQQYTRKQVLQKESLQEIGYLPWASDLVGDIVKKSSI